MWRQVRKIVSLTHVQSRLLYFVVFIVYYAESQKLKEAEKKYVSFLLLSLRGKCVSSDFVYPKTNESTATGAY